MEANDFFGKEAPKEVTLSSTKHPSEINEDAMQLDECRSGVLHSVTEKLLYVTKISQPDLDPTVSFLCTRVSKSDDNDVFVKVTINEKLII